MQDSIHCPECKHFFVIHWKEVKYKFNWKYSLFYRYFEGFAVGKDGEVKGITYFGRLRRFRIDHIPPYYETLDKR